MAAGWLAELDGSRVSVEVPASSANLGAGYDCLGLALAITNRIDLEVRAWSRATIELTVEGEGQGELTADRENRFVRACGTVMTLEREWKFPQVPVYCFVRNGPEGAQAEVQVKEKVGLR